LPDTYKHVFEIVHISLFVIVIFYVVNVIFVAGKLMCQLCSDSFF
jgi:hypothetical protein